MTRINLLPFRAIRKKENVRRQVSIYFLSLAFVVVVVGYLFISQSNTIGRLEAEETKKSEELEGYAETTKRLKTIKLQIAEIRSKLDVIRGLESKKTGPVHLLDEISMAVPKERLWLRSLVEREGVLTVEGAAMDNDTVALFMTSLAKAEHILSVDLKNTTSAVLADYKLNITNFILTCKIFSYVAEDVATGD